jgi:hypothetical protein
MTNSPVAWAEEPHGLDRMILFSFRYYLIP